MNQIQQLIDSIRDAPHDAVIVAGMFAIPALIALWIVNRMRHPERGLLHALVIASVGFVLVPSVSSAVLILWSRTGGDSIQAAFVSIFVYLFGFWAFRRWLRSAPRAVRRTGVARHQDLPPPVGAFLQEHLIHRTARGEMVRSKSEVIVANLLHSFNLMYAYEQPFTGRAGSVRYPDFTIGGAASGRRIFLEHLGMMSEPAYRESWQAKLAWYRSNGVMPIEEGEGDAGILITTSEDEGINSETIEGQIRSFLASELATIKRADIDGNDRIANLSGELTELRAEVARLRAERLDRASEDVAETSRHSSDPLSPRTR